MAELVIAAIITFSITALLSLIAALIRVGLLNRFAWARRLNANILNSKTATPVSEGQPPLPPTVTPPPPPIIVQMPASLSDPAEVSPRPSTAILNTPPRTKLIGRAKEKAEIATQLGKTTTNIVVLRGYGGVGKSTLARHVFHDYADRYPDGRYWLDLRGGHVDGQLRRFLATLDVEAPNNADVPGMMGLLRKAVAGKKVLVVLDNCESLPAPPSTQKWVQEQLYFAPPATVLVTTRASITPTDIVIETFDDADALEYLRVRLGWDEATATRERDDALALIHALGGLAQALETTTSRMRTLKQNCATTLARLRVNGVTGRADLHAAFEASYTLLSLDAQQMFRLLGICAPSGIAWGDLGTIAKQSLDEIESNVAALVEQSLAEADADKVELHPLIHDYALETAAQNQSEFSDLQVAHVRHFGLEVGGGYQRAIRDAQDGFPALNRIDATVDNVRLAQERAVTPTFPDLYLALATTEATYTYFNLRDEPKRLQWIEQATDAYKRLLHPNEEAQRDFATMMMRLGQAYLAQTNIPRALEYLRQSADGYRTLGNIRGLANALQEIGTASLFQKNIEHALDYYHQAETQYRALDGTVNNALGLANVAYGIGQAYVLGQEYDKALASLRKAEQQYRSANAYLGLAHTLLLLAWITQDDALFEESLALFARLNSPYNLAIGQYVFALHLRRQGHMAEGKTYLAETEVGFPAVEARYMCEIIKEATARWEFPAPIEPAMYWW